MGSRAGNRPPWIRLLAAIVAAAFILPLVLDGSLAIRIAGGAVILLCIGIAAQSGFALYRQRPDPYDLSRLWEEAPEEPSPVEQPLDLAYCHVCGASCPQAYATCPQCGNRLRG